MGKKISIVRLEYLLKRWGEMMREVADKAFTEKDKKRVLRNIQKEIALRKRQSASIEQLPEVAKA